MFASYRTSLRASRGPWTLEHNKMFTKRWPISWTQVIGSGGDSRRRTSSRGGVLREHKSIRSILWDAGKIPDFVGSLASRIRAESGCDQLCPYMVSPSIHFVNPFVQQLAQANISQMFDDQKYMGNASMLARLHCQREVVQVNLKNKIRLWDFYGKGAVSPKCVFTRMEDSPRLSVIFIFKTKPSAFWKICLCRMFARMFYYVYPTALSKPWWGSSNAFPNLI